jgi:hypothetical protein
MSRAAIVLDCDPGLAGVARLDRRAADEPR